MRILFSLFNILFINCLFAQINLPTWKESLLDSNGTKGLINLYSSSSDLEFLDGTTDRFKGYYATYDIKNKNSKIKINYTELPENHVKKFMDDQKTILLVNGGFFGKNGSLSLVINRNKLLSKNPSVLTRNGKKRCLSRPAFYIYKKNEPKISWVYTLGEKSFSLTKPISSKSCLDLENFVHNEENERISPLCAIGGGPMLIVNGKIISNYEKELFMDDVVNSKAPRTAIGITNDKKIIILLVEGRVAQSKGVSLQTLSKILKGIGCENAMNLDGGGSSFMYAYNEKINKFSTSKIRKIASSIAISIN